METLMMRMRPIALPEGIERRKNQTRIDDAGDDADRREHGCDLGELAQRIAPGRFLTFDRAARPGKREHQQSTSPQADRKLMQRHRELRREIPAFTRGYVRRERQSQQCGQGADGSHKPDWTPRVLLAIEMEDHERGNRNRESGRP